MNSCDFFTNTDILTALQDEQKKTLDYLMEINEEITSVMGEMWELVLEAQREVDNPEGKRYTVDLRIFNGFGDEEKTRLSHLLEKYGFAVKA